MSTTPEKAPDKAEYVTMTFEKGIPKSINGEEMKVSDIIRKLNELGGKHGIGIIDIVENRVVGMKSKENGSHHCVRQSRLSLKAHRNM